MQTVGIELFREAVAFTLTLRKFNNRRKGDMKHVETDTKKERLNLSKKLLDSPELDAITEFQADLYRWCTMRCMPSFFKDGIYIVKTSEVAAFESKLNQARGEMAELIGTFQGAYDRQIDQARLELNGMFNAKDYPRSEDLPGRFGIEWNWIAFGVPENLPAELRAAEAAKIESQFRDAETQIMAALREGFADVLSHVSDRLTVKPGDKEKTFRDSLFSNLTEFIGTFNARNLCNDKDLGAMVTRANEILATVRGDKTEEKAQVVRDSRFIRDQTAKAFADLKASVDASITQIPTRKMRLDD
jgi:hypothetical protein